MRRKATIGFALLATTCLAPLRAGLAGELPTGASVVSGAVGIATPGANAMTIQQSSAAAIVNWQSFSVGAGASVNIRQPSTSSALLNRVTGATTSTIAGQISANGQVYLVNPNGIVITPSGSVTAGGGFVASTLGISDEDFKAGRRNFAGTGSSAAVVNRGTIEVGRGGYAALIGGSVENAGTISVPMGKVGLGAGERATLDISGDGFLQVAVPSGSAGEKALIQNSGRIRADGGRVEMQAATAREVARQAINLTGVVEARTVGGRSGAIVLGGGAGGTVTVSGRLDASATRQGRRAGAAHARSAASGKGGAITVTGDRIQLSGATLDASGRTGGGTIRVGGDLQGKGDLPHARKTFVDRDTRILADATESGNGGNIVVWSDEFTGFGGLIRARGGPNGGDGGFAEVSSKGVLGYNGQTILTAAKGRFGTLLLDPYDIYIEGGSTSNGAFTGSPPTLDFVPSGTNSVINVTDLQNALATANVTISTGDSSSVGAQAGNITVGAAVNWTQTSTLTLDAANNIVIGEAITAPAGGLVLSAGGTITTPALYGRSDGTEVSNTVPGGAIAVSIFDLRFSTWTQSGALPAFAATDFRLTSSSFLRALSGDGSSSNPYQITDVYGLQGINSGANRGLDFRLANNIDASGTSGWNAGAGFTPIGSSPTGSAYSGTFNGAGYSVANLTINRPGSTYVGLFGAVSGTVSNLALTGANVTGGSDVGAIVGSNTGTVSHVWGSGNVSGTTNVGGLVGSNSRGIDTVYSAVTVQGGTTATSVGGLVGNNTGAISRSSATGSVTSGSGSSFVGGLVGSNGGSVSESYSTGAVNGGIGSTGVGGLVGGTAGEIESSFWDTTTSGQTVGIGSVSGDGTTQVTGLTTAQFQNPGTFVPLARGQGWNLDFYWAPPSAGFYPQLHAMFPIVHVQTSDATRLYGDPNPVFTPTYLSSEAYAFAPAGDTLSLGNTLFSPATATSPVGAYPILGADVTSTLGITYRLVVTQTDAALAPSLAVTPAPLTVTANDQTKTYGSTFTFLGTEFGAAGLKNGETIGSAALSSTGSPATAGVGPYPILVSGATGGTFDPTNYAITYVQGTMTVNQAPLTLTANDQTKTYGSTFTFLGTEFGAAGLQNGETVGSATLSSTGAPATAGVGPYPILIGGATGGTFDPANYAITYVQGTMTVNQAPLTLTANDQTKTYGSPFAFLGTEFGAAGLQNGETIDSATLSSTGSPATANAGLHPILIGGATGTAFNPANYAITYVPGTMTVTPAPLTLTANDQTRTYGSPFAFLGTEFGATGLRNGETVGTAALSSPGAASTAGAGLYQILIGSAAGGTFNPANYNISYVPGTMSVARAPLTVAANDQFKILGLPFTFTGLEFTAFGLQNGETIGSATLSSEGASALAGAGAYAIAVGGATGGTFNPANYTLAYVPGTMTVGAAATLIDTPPAGNPTPLLPTTTIALPNPPDSFDLTGGGGSGGGGPTLGTGESAARGTLTAIERSSNDLEASVASCDSRFERQKAAAGYKSCVAGALDKFADALDARGVDLPGPMRGIPAVIRQAARQVRAARTVQEARAAVGAAVAEVRKAIALIRADDPAIGRLQIQQANRIASALGSVENRLSRATGL